MYTQQPGEQVIGSGCTVTEEGAFDRDSQDISEGGTFDIHRI